jgi:hypothetical protein
VGASIDQIAGDLDDLVEQRILTAQADGFRFRVAPERTILNETMSALRRDLLRQRSLEVDMGSPGVPRIVKHRDGVHPTRPR